MSAFAVLTFITVSVFPAFFRGRLTCARFIGDDAVGAFRAYGSPDTNFALYAIIVCIAFLRERFAGARFIGHDTVGALGTCHRAVTILVLSTILINLALNRIRGLGREA